MLQLNLNQPGRCPTLASPAPFFRSFAALGRQGPKQASAAPQAAQAAAATAAPEKKPASAYALYVKEAFPRTKASNPQAAFADISKQVSSQWKSLSQTQKSEYENAYVAAKADWDKRFPNGAPATPKRGKAAAPDAAANGSTAPKAKKDKKPPTAYALFVKQNFGDYKKEGASAPDTMKVLAGAWKGLSDAEKAKYKAS